ncbi:MAG: ribonuclease J [Acidimicrobiia bacterium]|nr:ribonuclease J [Acidimicrobiia bacterium]
MTVSVSFLGGLGEIGRNCAVLETHGRLALIDCGLMFPEEEMLGVDLVLPDFSWVIDRRRDVCCVVLTHGHEDHVGALAYFLREVPVPVYGTALTVELARSRVEEIGIEPDLRAVKTGEWIEEGPMRFALIDVAHSVPQATGVVFDTDEGLIVHSGDFKLDPTPIDGSPTDLGAFAGFGRRGVRLLLADSTNAEIPGFTPSEATIGQPIADLTARAEGRVIIACFASHVHRVQQAVDAVVGAGRKIAFLGRSMLRNTEVAARLGLLEVPKGSVLPLDELLSLPPRQTAVICTGSQGEPFAALSLMAQGEHRAIKLRKGDTVILSATPIPGNETKVFRVINNLARLGVIVHHGRNAPVHVSGHAARDELATFINVVSPQAFVPVHGEYRHLVAHAELASTVGVTQVEVCEDGDRVVLRKGRLRVERAAFPAGYVYIDGSGIGDVDGVLRDRRHLADDGVLIVTVGVDMASGEIVVGPEVDSHGITDDTKALHTDITAAVEKAVAELSTPIDRDGLNRTVRRESGRIVKRTLDRRPVVIPVLLEV